MIEWIFFDIGSTLFDEDLCHEKRFCMIEDEIRAKFGRILSYKDEILPLIKEGARRRSPSPVRYATETLGISFPRYPREYEVLYSGAPDTLRALYGRYRLGVIANQPSGLPSRLAEYGIGEFFDLVVGSDDVGISKPDRRIFEIALERAGVLPEHAVMVGDRYDNDIIPARKMKMRTVRVASGFFASDTARSAAESADAEINDISELPEVVAGL